MNIQLYPYFAFSDNDEESILYPKIETGKDDDEVNGAKFGSSVACLGKSDSGDKRELVVVGAPFFDKVDNYNFVQFQQNH